MPIGCSIESNENQSIDWGCTYSRFVSRSEREMRAHSWEMSATRRGGFPQCCRAGCRDGCATVPRQGAFGCRTRRVHYKGNIREIMEEVAAGKGMGCCISSPLYHDMTRCKTEDGGERDFYGLGQGDGWWRSVSRVHGEQLEGATPRMQALAYQERLTLSLAGLALCRQGNHWKGRQA